MTKRIFHSICIVAISVFLASILLFLIVLYNYFSEMQKTQLKMQLNLASQGAIKEGVEFFEELDISDYRITWIGRNGIVLYDSKSDSLEMENHLEREEIQQAFSEGAGESIRYSKTLMERLIYCAKRLPDGTVLRLSTAQNTLFTLALGMFQPICIIFIIALILSLVLASRLSRDIVKPLNELNLDHPLEYGYSEILPLTRRIAAQKCQIREQEEELRRRKNEFEAVSTGMAEGIILLSEKTIILSINPAAMRLFSADCACVGKYFQAIHRSLELQELLQNARDGKHAEIVMELNGGNYQFGASPVFSEGVVSGVVLLILDVTEKEKAEQMRQEFTANVSHELKTPLHTISGSAELMANGMVPEKEMEKFANRIYIEAQRAIHLVEDIIKLSHLDKGASDLKREKVDLCALAEETVQTLFSEAEMSNIQIKFSGETAFVYGIRQLLEGIIYNLCDNAIKYNRPGGSVSVFVKEEEGGVKLLVSDTGIGIPKEHHERIFERFYRVDKSHSKEIGGTGLGLSIVKHAARLHNAVIELQSVPDCGTDITIHFPISLYKNFTQS